MANKDISAFLRRLRIEVTSVLVFFILLFTVVDIYTEHSMTPLNALLIALMGNGLLTLSVAHQVVRAVTAHNGKGDSAKDDAAENKKQA